MAEAKVSPACILLVCGIPGSGKTMLAASLLEHCRKELQGAVGSEGGRVEGDIGPSANWNLFAIHFDDFYPPDLREQEVIGICSHTQHIFSHITKLLAS